MQFIQQLKLVNDYIWWYYSMLACIPLIIIALLKFKNQPTYSQKDENRKSQKKDAYDRWVFLLTFYSTFYYTFDTIFKFTDGYEITMCKQFSVIHHVVSFLTLPHIIYQPHYPWFLVAVPAFHSILLTFPQYPFLEWIYTCFVLRFHWGIHQYPFTTLRNYKMIQIGIWGLYLALALLKSQECTNIFVPGKGYIG